MKSKNKKNVSQNTSPLLTNEEIVSVNGFGHLTAEETEAVASFVYNISIILYKSCIDGKS